MMTIISAPVDHIVATNDGVDVRFVGIEVVVDVPVATAGWLGTHGIRLHLEGVRSPETQRRDEHYVAEMSQWANLRERDGAETAGDSPAMPGQLVLGPVRANISDDIGTTYRCDVGQVAGSGTDWEATWVYLPEPPDTARFLHIEFTVAGEPTGKTCKVEIG
ncbi:hypothetical protein [Paeniglutamicibacter sp.]|uniref:hypothetical protein n=1 Tax=Paeniglutamicibacter sp. TaxID=1934391 RepID=UPI00398958B3